MLAAAAAAACPHVLRCHFTPVILGGDGQNGRIITTEMFWFRQSRKKEGEKKI
jgi:hypothetical protein